METRNIIIDFFFEPDISNIKLSDVLDFIYNTSRNKDDDFHNYIKLRNSNNLNIILQRLQLLDKERKAINFSVSQRQIIPNIQLEKSEIIRQYIWGLMNMMIRVKYGAYWEN